ncbi:MAG: hemolysin family protein [Gammaproteobacteria bacterium]|nr:hemolysin family protein [Gammaproteobacteria bacterium]
MDFLLLVALILFNGLFAMAELAIVSARRARLQPRADKGNLGARAALELHQQPSTFLSTVQVGITMVGVTSGAIGDTIIAEPLTAWLQSRPTLAPYASEIALTATITAITYFSVVVGELVPKRLALIAPEPVAILLALPMRWLSLLARPLVWIFSISSEVLLRLLGAHRHEQPPVTNAEIEGLMEQGAEAGVFHQSEQALVANILRLDEQHIGAIMTPRVDIEHVDLDDAPEEVTRSLLESTQNRLVVCRDGLEHVLGVLPLVDLLKDAVAAGQLDIASLEGKLQPALFVPRSISTVHLLEELRRARQQFALVVGEYGDLQGVVTLTDVLTAIVGDLEPDRPAHERDIIVREDGSWLVDGSVVIERFEAVAGVELALPGAEEEDFYTLGGFVMHARGRMPVAGDRVEAGEFVVEVVDMDGTRVDKLLVMRRAVPTAPQDED